jgi:hypothetical protein
MIRHCRCPINQLCPDKWQGATTPYATDHFRAAINRLDIAIGNAVLKVCFDSMPPHTSPHDAGSCRHSLIALRLFDALAWAERSHLLPAVVQEKPNPDHRKAARPPMMWRDVCRPPTLTKESVLARTASRARPLPAILPSTRRARPSEARDHRPGGGDRRAASSPPSAALPNSSYPDGGRCGESQRRASTRRMPAGCAPTPNSPSTAPVAVSRRWRVPLAASRA